MNYKCKNYFEKNKNNIYSFLQQYKYCFYHNKFSTSAKFEWKSSGEDITLQVVQARM